MTFTVLMDVVVSALLVATITYAVVLDRHIRQLREARKELETMVVGFNAATARAESAIGDLKIGTEAGSRELKPLVAKAREIADDLAFLVERGNELADRLDAGVGAARAVAPRPETKSPTPKAAARPAAAGAAPRPVEGSRSRVVSEAEHALLEALRSVR